MRALCYYSGPGPGLVTHFLYFHGTRATVGTVARLGVVPLSKAMVHVSIHDVVVWPLVRFKVAMVSRSAIGQLRPWEGLEQL